MTATTQTGLDNAAAIFRTNWDENGTTAVHLPRAIAQQLLFARGWKYERQQWIAPDGRTFWETDEALMLALTAEVA